MHNGIVIIILPITTIITIIIIIIIINILYSISYYIITVERMFKPNELKNNVLFID